ncbi:MAG: hypothetical protein Q7I94_00685 [Candidatus Contubernalis sp.]|nr:hypothetical protein [Candidatus Contubernalis sp.]
MILFTMVTKIKYGVPLITLITTLVEAQGMICISQNKEGIEKGEEVEVILYT